jgi:hypothetical protein
MAEIREQVCTRCSDRPPGGPPCAPRAKHCGLELHLPQLVDAVQGVHSLIVDQFHKEVCTHCPHRPPNQIPCPHEYLLTLAMKAIETVDQRQPD